MSSVTPPSSLPSFVSAGSSSIQLPPPPVLNPEVLGAAPAHSQPPMAAVTSNPFSPPESVTPLPPPHPEKKVELPPTAPLKEKSPLPHSHAKPISEGLKELESELDTLEQNEGESVFGWISKTVTGSKFLSAVADKAKVCEKNGMKGEVKAGMDTVLISLDPGMADVLSGDGSIALTVASEDPRVAEAVKRGFQKVFVNVELNALPVPQVESVERAQLQCESRVTRLLSSRLVSSSSPLVVVSSFISSFASSSFLSSCLLLHKKELRLWSFSQPLPIDDSTLEHLRKRAREAKSRTGEFPLSVSQAIVELKGAGASESWASSWLPYSLPDFLVLPSAVLASSLKRHDSAIEKEKETH